MADINLNLFAPHEEAARIIRDKPAVSRQVFDGLLPELRARAITVTGLQRLDAVERIRESIASLAEGKVWADAKAEIVEELGFLEDGAEQRAELLLRTHAFQAFQTSTWRSAQADDDTTHLQYLATEDAKVRASHLALNGLVFPKKDTFWHDHTPPWEWGCRCRIRALSPDDVADYLASDAKRNPEDRLVMEGPRAEKARQGDLLRGPQTLPDGRKTSGGPIDVKAPAQKRTAKTPYQYHPDNLRLSVDDLKKRYAPEEWDAFEGWASKTDVTPDRTVMEWLRGSELPPPPAPEAAPPQPPPAPAIPAPAPAPTRQAPVSRSLSIGALPPPLKAAVNDALAIADKVHDDGKLTPIPVNVALPKKGKKMPFGSFVRSRFTGQSKEIQISPRGDHPELTTLHEIGHWLDNDAIGTPNALESGNAGGLLADVLRVCRGTQAVRNLETFRAGHRVGSQWHRHANYLLSPEEIWARAYSQFVAERGGGSKLLAQLEGQRKKMSGLQWETVDFEPVKLAIETLFSKLGWL